MKPIKVGLLGIGTVGGGTFTVLRRNQAEIKRRAGRGIEIVMVAARNIEKAQALVAQLVPVVSDPFEVVNHPDIDIVVETSPAPPLSEAAAEWTRQFVSVTTG